MVDFSKLKSQSGKKSLESLNQELSKFTKGNSKGDDRYWSPTVDKAGNGYAVLRFLPAPPNEDIPFIQMWDHGFQGPGGWYIEKSRTTLGSGEADPVSEYNSKLWNSGIESNKEIARKQKRRLHFIANIYVVEDSANPANNGKVFLFKFGKKIFEKLNEAMNPQFADEEAMNPFDLWAGANFKLKIRNVEGYRNYDKSEFASAGPLSNDDAELEALWKQEHSLAEIIDPKNFKSYDELTKRLARVLGESVSAPARAEEEDDIPFEGGRRIAEEAAPTFKATSAGTVTNADDEDDEENLEFFKKLAKR